MACICVDAVSHRSRSVLRRDHQPVAVHVEDPDLRVGLQGMASFAGWMIHSDRTRRTCRSGAVSSSDLPENPSTRHIGRGRDLDAGTGPGGR